ENDHQVCWTTRAEWSTTGFGVMNNDRIGQQLTVDQFPFLTEQLQEVAHHHIYNVLDLPVGERNLLALDTINSLLIIPVPGRYSLPGFIGFGTVSATREWADYEIAGLQTVADALTNTIAREELFNQVQQALSETEILYNMSGKLNRVTDLEEVLETVASPDIIEGIHRASLFTIDQNESGTPEWGELVATWSNDTSPTSLSPIPKNTRFFLSDYPMTSLWLSNSESPILISNTATDQRIDSDLQAVYQQMNALAMAILPLTLGRQWQGLIILYWITPYQFTSRAQRLYQSIASQAAVVVNNWLLLQQAEQRANQTEQLYGASRRINEARDAQGIVNIIAQAGPLANLSRVVLHHYHQGLINNMETLPVVAAWHHQKTHEIVPVGVAYALADHPHLNMFLTPNAQFFSDVEYDETLSLDMLDMCQTLGIKAMVILPLWVGARQLGVLRLELDQPYTFSEQERQSCIALMSQIAVATENQRLLEETSEALTEAEQAQRRYTLQAWQEYQNNQEIIQYEVVRGQTGDTSPLNPGSDIDKIEQSSHSTLTIPLAIRGEIIGQLGLAENQDREWTPEEVAFVEAVAEQMAQAAENIRLLDETQQRAAREKRVNEIGDKIQAAQSLEEALQIAVKEVGLSLKTSQTNVQLNVE
ncbi:MAG: GAF domain-containing protein, partial [Chloroflexota bacterium]